jgi:starvation-inducible DNA-binding protein
MAAKDAVSNSKTGRQRSTPPQPIKVDIGLDQKANQGVADLFCQALADEFTFYTKLRKYHWNVTGPDFFSLHEAFEKQYKETEENIDEIAEYIRTYGVFSPGTLEEFRNMTTLEEEPGVVPSATQMVANVVADHEAIIRSLRDMVEKAQNQYEDAAAADIFTEYIEEHQKAAWMMRAFLQGLDTNEQ